MKVSYKGTLIIMGVVLRYNSPLVVIILFVNFFLISTFLENSAVNFTMTLQKYIIWY